MQHARTQSATPQDGFTLIELLVVISILALLISILLPALSATRHSAQAVACLSNLRQINIGFATYQPDFDGYYPVYRYAAGQPAPYDYPSGELLWTGYMWRDKYLASQLYADPGFVERTHNRFADVLPSSTSASAYLFARPDYGYNYTFVGSSLRVTPGDRTPARNIDINKPSQTIMLADSFDKGLADSTGRYEGKYAIVGHPNDPNYLAHARHNSAVNITWTDGHASALSVADRDNPYTTGLTKYSNTPSYWDRK